MAIQLTNNGLIIDSMSEIISDLQDNYKANFGADLSLAPTSPDNIKIGIFSEGMATIQAAMQMVYQSQNPLYAGGEALTNIGQLTNTYRLRASASTTTLSLTGTNGTVIPAKSQVSNGSNDTIFETYEDVTISSSGTATVRADCIVTGATTASAGTLTKIITLTAGWTSVTNLEDASLGRDAETDVEYRARRTQSVAIGSSNQLESTYAAVSGVPGVSYVTILENDSGTIDPTTFQPSGTYQCFVFGGDTSEIASAIASKKPLGATSYGTTTTGVEDSKGISRAISFSRPVREDLYIDISVEPTTTTYGNLAERIKEKLVAYISDNFTMGEDIPVNKVLSIFTTDPDLAENVDYVNTLAMGLTASPTTITGRVVVPYNVLVETLEANIDVTIT